MFEQMSEYEPREALVEALGMVKAMRRLENNDWKQDALDDIALHIRYTLRNGTIFKNMEDKKHE